MLEACADWCSVATFALAYFAIANYGSSAIHTAEPPTAMQSDCTAQAAAAAVSVSWFLLATSPALVVLGVLVGVIR
jgi:uncharacterized membrane protein YccF (DUF307 family)